MQKSGAYRLQSRTVLTSMPLSSHYSPFGSLISNRSWSDASREYRYGFNSQEMDNEVAGIGNSYTAEFWQYDGRLGRRFNIDPYVKHYESAYSCFSNNPITLIDKNGADTQTFSAGVCKAKKEKSFWGEMFSSAVKFIDFASDYVPVVSGIKQAVKSAIVGDWKGAALGIGESVIDGVLLVTTGGIGNVIKTGGKASAKIITKTLAKETGENIVSETISDGATQVGVPNSVQIAASIFLGIHNKPKWSKGYTMKQGKKRYGDKFRIDKAQKNPDGTWKHGSEHGDEIEFGDGRTIYKDGTWKHGKDQGLTKEDKEFLEQAGWIIPNE